MSTKLLNHKVKIISIISLIAFLINSCKKEEIPLVRYENTNVDQLTGDTSVLVGTWLWIYTDHTFGWCDNDNNYELLTPMTENCKFEIRIYTNGYLNYYKNDSLISQYRTSFQYFDFNSLSACGPNYKQFAIDLDGFENLNFGGCVSIDSLMCFAPGFLFYEKAGCEIYQSWFAKK